MLVSLLPAFPVLAIPEALRKVLIATFCDLVKASTEKKFLLFSPYWLCVHAVRKGLGLMCIGLTQNRICLKEKKMPTSHYLLFVRYSSAERLK